jgi:serine/threonine protein kinase
MPGLDDLAVRSFRERCALAAQLGARLDHPNVLKVYGMEESEGEIGLVMEYAPGGSLQDRLDFEGRLSIDETAQASRASRAVSSIESLRRAIGHPQAGRSPSRPQALEHPFW